MRTLPGLLAAALASGAAAQTTVRVSVSSFGGQGSARSCAVAAPAISADGRRVAFESTASDLAPLDLNGTEDVLVRDLPSGSTAIASRSTLGLQGNGRSDHVALSADGRFVAFQSAATNLDLSPDTNGSPDVFWRDATLGITRRVSVSSSGAQGSAGAIAPAISADGQLVAFQSASPELVAGDSNGVADVFLRRVAAGTTERVSATNSGGSPNASSHGPAISADGRFVAFYGAATNLVPGPDANSALDVFVRDLQTGAVELVSATPGGVPANAASLYPVLSADGRYVAFMSLATDLGPADPNGIADVYRRDRQTGTTVLVTVSIHGGPGNERSYLPSISADGRFVAFESVAYDLVPGDANGSIDVFLRDVVLGQTTLVSRSITGAQGNAGSSGAAISADATRIAFRSDASNLVSGDTNGARDVFVRELSSPFTTFCEPGLGGTAPCPCSNPPSGPGRGCDNHGSSTGGASLAGSGEASLASDSVVLVAAGENATALTVIWTGTIRLPPPGFALGAGIRCVGDLDRLYVGVASGGAIARPGPGDASVSARSAAVGAPILPGQTRHYFAAYRDPQAAAPCGDSAATVNATSAVSALWGP